MLIQFRVENHRSLRDEQTLSMVAADTLEPEDPRLIHVPGLDVTLLPAVALYGANASGKSNVVGALGFMRDAVLASHRPWEPESGTPQEPFLLSDKEQQPSLYEVDFILDDIRYCYGFVLSAESVEEEWLHTWHEGQRQTWFERQGDEFDFGENLGGENDAIKAMTRSNSLFLSSAAQNNHRALLPLYGWFRRARFELRHGASRGIKSLRTHFFQELFGAARQLSLFPDLEDSNVEARQRRRDAVLRLLRSADIGITDMKVVEEDDVLSSGRRSRRPELYFMHRSDDAGRNTWLPLSAQSAGTVTLLEIAVPLMHVLEDGGLLCVDELEASLHPKLALELLRLFNDPQQNPHGAQLVFTTHDTNLLGNALGEPVLRRDQVWFTEKDQTGATHLYPLTDFHPRQEENLERGYLQGRYGAVPFLGQLVAPRTEGD